jgi:phosphatidylserine/phosphatidylglycerophosphate/cardiolipin synthase-like enzyme
MVFGSSNFGRRSYERDFESQVYLVTTNKALQDKFCNEYQQLQNYTEVVQSNLWKQDGRKLHGFGWKHGRWIKPIAALVARYF